MLKFDEEEFINLNINFKWSNANFIKKYLLFLLSSGLDVVVHFD